MLASLPTPLTGGCGPAKNFAQHSPFIGSSAKKLAQRA